MERQKGRIVWGEAKKVSWKLTSTDGGEQSVYQDSAQNGVSSEEQKKKMALYRMQLTQDGLFFVKSE